MKTNIKRAMSIAIATLITVGSTGTYATSFNDISGHWAKTYIEKGKKLDLIKGYEDGSFKPQENISRIQTISLCARLLNVPQSEVDKLETNYSSILIKNNVPPWAIGDFSVALANGIVDQSILNKLFSYNGAEVLSPREEVVIFLARAIGLEKEVQSKGSNVTLKFKDSNNIDNQAKPYVLVMNEKKIIDGDDNGNFNPKMAITRAEMAKVLSSSYEYLANNKKKDDEIINVIGNIQNTFSAGNKNYILVRNTMGVEKNYEINNQSVLKIGDKVVAYSDLKVGLAVSLEVLQDSQGGIGIVKSLNSQVSVDKYTGTIYSLNDYAKTLTIEYQQGGIRNRNEYSINQDTEIILDGKKSSFSDLRRGDDIKIEVINNRIIKIDAEAKARDIKGVLKDINTTDKIITVEDKDGNRTKYDLDKNVKIVRDRRTVDLDKLKKGDEVEIHVEDKKVTTIEAKIISTEIEGTIRRKTIGYDESEITILNNKTKKEETYKIPKDASIELDGERARLDKLELGYYVVVTLEGEEIVKMKGQSTTINNKHLGRISEIERSYLKLTLQDGTTVEVIFEDTIVRENETGREISTRSLNKGDAILVTGEIYQGEIIADEITRFAK